MFFVYILIGLVSLLIASYVSALGLVYVLNLLFFKIPFDIFAYLQCPISTTCVEFGTEYKGAITTFTIVIFTLSGIIAPVLYYRREHKSA